MTDSTHAVLVLRVPAPAADEISDRIWAEAGVLGIQESPPAGSDMFAVAEGFEVLEFGSEAAKRCATWLEKESFRKGATLRLQIFIDPPEGFVPEEFARRVAGDREVSVESFARLEATDYLQKYRDSEQGTAFGENLWIGPPWAEPPAGAQAFRVEPGLAFGTGGHPTTQLCFERLVELARDAPKRQAWRKVLDLGTGTGILGVGVRRFFPQAELMVADLDPLCEEEVRKTFELNQLGAQLPAGRFGPAGTAARIADEGLRFDVVVSNIYAEILAQIAGDVARLLPPGGRWITSGILRGPAEEALKRAAPGHFRLTWEAARARDVSQLDSQGGLKAMQETWVACEFVRI